MASQKLVSMRENPILKARRAAILARSHKVRLLNNIFHKTSDINNTEVSLQRNNDNIQPRGKIGALASLRMRSRALKNREEAAMISAYLHREVMNTRWSKMPPRPCACGK